MKHKENKFGTVIPKKITNSYLKFATEIHDYEILILLLFFGRNKVNVREKLAEVYKDPGNETAEKLTKQIQSGEFDEGFYGQMSYAKVIDNLLTYFKDILSEIIKKPNTLKSKETEKLDFILYSDTLNDLEIALSEKKIEALFYEGIDKIEEYFIQKLGINIFKSDTDKKNINQAIKNRNLIIYNNSIIHEKYLKEFPESGFHLNDKLKFEYDDFLRINLIFLNFVAELDYELHRKFSLDLINNY